MQIKNITSFLLGSFFVIVLLISWYSIKNYKQLLEFFSHSAVASKQIDMQKALEKENSVPLLIIGSGCAGYSAAIYGARGRVKTVLLTGNMPGGQLSGTTKVENWPGLLHELGPTIMQNVKKQAETFGAQVVNDSVSIIDFSQWPFLVTTEDGKKLYALTIVLATGASPALLNIPGEQEYWGKGVTTCAICDAPFHKGNDVIVVGGGDSAAEEALQLAAYAKTVTVVVRKSEMRASPGMQKRLKEIPNISVLYHTEIESIIGDENEVTSVQIVNNQTQEKEYKNVSGVFLAIGHTPNSAFVSNQITTDKEGYVALTTRSQQTNIPGVFAAGDVEDRVYRQAGVAAGSGIKAALDALNFLQAHGFTPEIAKKMKKHYFKPESARVSSVMKLSTIQEFEEIRKNKRIFVVDFFTNFCPSCMQMMPAIESVAYKYIDRVAFYKVDASQFLELAQMYHVAAVPAILVFKDGSLVGRYNQAMTKKQLIEFVERFL